MMAAMGRAALLAGALVLAASGAAEPTDAVGAERVLLIVNQNSQLSRDIGEYYARARNIPARNICYVKTTSDEEVPRDIYDSQVAAPVSACLRKQRLEESVYYIVTTGGVPLKIDGTSGLTGEHAAVDSELALLYTDLHSGQPHSLTGSLPNPFFGKRDQPFSHPQFPIYLVTRLAAYDLDGVKAIIDRALHATNRGRFVLDLNAPDDVPGNDWLRTTAILLPANRVVIDETTRPLYDQTDVIGYGSWGSNDTHHNRRFPGFHWLPGGIATAFVSTDGRTFARPPNNWVPGGNWIWPPASFAHSPQSLVADSLFEGATGGSGHVYEPYLNFTPRPDLLFPAYYSGRNLAESFYLAIPALSWQNIVVGDPLCSLGTPKL